jgi:hypothetical protein
MMNSGDADMSEIKRIQRKIEKLYRAIEEPEIDVPLAVQVRQWVSFAEEYISAASIVDSQAPLNWLSRLLMTGQAVELALKACLAAANVIPPNHHNLIQLYELASKHGFHLDNPDLAAIVHLGHFYFQDLVTSTKYKTRYPATKTERLGVRSRITLHSYLSFGLFASKLQSEMRETLSKRALNERFSR